MLEKNYPQYTKLKLTDNIQQRYICKVCRKVVLIFRVIIANGVSQNFVVGNVSFYIDIKEHICGVCYECD